MVYRKKVYVLRIATYLTLGILEKVSKGIQ